VRFRGLAAWLALGPLAVALDPRTRGGLSRPRLLMAGAAAVLGLGWLARAPPFEPGGTPPGRAGPVRATALPETLRAEGPGLNPFHYGGYRLWAGGESHPPLVDGRGRGSLAFRSRFARAYSDPVALDSLLSEWRFTHAILEPPISPADHLGAELGRRREWA